MTTPPLIETERLLIGLMDHSDEGGMWEMDSDPRVHKFVGNKPVTDRDYIRTVIDMVQQQYADLGIGRWSMIDKHTGSFVGWTGFKRITGTVNGHTDYIDFGYRLPHRCWGMGYATEAGRACLQYGRDVLGYKDIYATTDVGNAASRHVLQKLNFEYKGIFDYDGEPTWRHTGEPTTWYELKLT